jgi:hypothetical protein
MRLIAALLIASLSAVAQTSELFSQVDGMLASLSRITGWQVKHKVPSEALTRDKFAKLIEESVAESEHDKETRAAELTLKMFGLVPWDFNLAREAADLLEEQTAAFYDFKKKRLFVLEGAPDDAEQRVALAHELAHALADQQFNIRKYLESAKGDDADTARQSVIEGQASWLSWAYMSERSGGRPEVPAKLLDELADVGATGDDFPVLTQTPLYMRESLTFPYSAGMKFQDAIYREFGTDAFSRVFRDAPLSTQEILHPDAYDDGVMPTQPVIPKALIEDVLGKNASLKLLTEGDVGEFDFSAILRQYGNATQGRMAAAHWRGGIYRLYEQKVDKAPLLVHASDWDSPAAAREFFRLYLGVLRAKWKHIEIKSDTISEVTGTGDTGDFVLRIEGASVQCLEGAKR